VARTALSSRTSFLYFHSLRQTRNYITGGTALTGSHIIFQLLEQGQYQVRGVARSASKLQSIFPNGLEIVERPTLTSDYIDMLEGVCAVIHVASATCVNGATGEEIFEVDIVSFMVSDKI